MLDTVASFLQSVSKRGGDETFGGRCTSPSMLSAPPSAERTGNGKADLNRNNEATMLKNITRQKTVHGVHGMSLNLVVKAKRSSGREEPLKRTNKAQMTTADALRWFVSVVRASG